MDLRENNYDNKGLITEWGVGDMKQVFRISKVVDNIQSAIDVTGTRKQRRYRLRRAWYRCIDRIKNRIDEIHKKMSSWLVQNYSVILIPKFDVKHMVKKKERKLNKKTARSMLCWAHFRFRQRLIAKAELYGNCKVIECDEAYTSKTCGGCGNLNQKLGSKKLFVCTETSCDYEADRDVNAARNILLRYLTLRKIQPHQPQLRASQQ